MILLGQGTTQLYTILEYYSLLNLHAKHSTHPLTVHCVNRNTFDNCFLIEHTEREWMAGQTM